MRLILDIDDVVRDWSDQAVWVLKSHDINVWPKPDYDFATWTSLGKDVYPFLFNKYADEIYCNAPPVKDALRYIEKLHDHGHEIIFATSQFQRNIRRYTLDWLLTYDVDFDGIHFTDRKWQVTGDVFVEDREDHLIRYQYYNYDNRPKPLIIAFDRPWNKQWSGERVDNWKKLYKRIKQHDADRIAKYV